MTCRRLQVLTWDDARVERGVGRGAEAPGRTFGFHGVVLVESLRFCYQLTKRACATIIIVQKEAGRGGVEAVDDVHAHVRYLSPIFRGEELCSTPFKYVAIQAAKQTL